MEKSLWSLSDSDLEMELDDPTREDLDLLLEEYIRRDLDLQQIDAPNLTKNARALELYAQNAIIPPEEARVILTRSIERNYPETYEVIARVIQEEKYQLEPLQIRPYLIPDINMKLLEKSKKELGVYDAEIFGETYNHLTPKEALLTDQYFGYRQAWYLLYYTPERKNQLKLLWQNGFYDCTYEAAVDYLLWTMGVPLSEWAEHPLQKEIHKDILDRID